MIKSIEIENFKCYGERVTIPMAPITLLYGENSAGKSTVLQALRFLCETRDGDPKTKKIYSELVHDGLKIKPVIIALNSVVGDGCCRFAALYDNAHQWSVGKVEVNNDKGLQALLQLQNRKFEGTVEFPFSQSAWASLVLKLNARRDDIVKGYSRLAEFRALLDLGKSDSVLDFGKFAVEYFKKKGGKSLDDRPDMDTGELSIDAVNNKIEVTDDSSFCSIYEEFCKLFRRYALEYAADLDFFSQEISVEAYMNRCAKKICLNFSVPRWAAWALRRKSYSNSAFYSVDKLNNFERDMLCMGNPDLVLCLNRSDHSIDNDWADSDTVRGYNPELRLESHVSVDLDGLDFKGMMRYGNFGENLVAKLIEAAIPERFVQLDALREKPSMSYVTAGNDKQSLPARLHTNAGLKRSINKWMDTLDVGYHVDTEASSDGKQYSLKMIDVRRETEHMHSYDEVGFGISQILPIVASCLSRDPAIITIEQPELHIHPRLQAELGSLFEEAKKLGHQIIAETHSEHLMLRVQRLIRQRALSVDDVVVLYVSRGKNGSTVQRLRIDENGEFIDEWPGGFFEESFKEVFGS